MLIGSSFGQEKIPIREVVIEERKTIFFKIRKEIQNLELHSFQSMNPWIEMEVTLFLSFIFLFLISVIGLGLFAGFRLLHPKRVRLEESLKAQKESYEIPEPFWKQTPEFFRIDSDFGYKLTGNYIRGTNNRVIIFCHGISWNRLGALKYMNYFLENGWHIFYYDHRGAGESGGTYPSFGRFEKFDLGKIVDYALALLPKTETIGLHGESMGGATVLQYSIMDPRIQFIVAICPFTSLKGLIRFYMEKLYIPRPIQPIIRVVINSYLYYYGGFSTHDVYPEDDILQSPIPVLLFHGKKDAKVPFEMSQSLYRKRKEIYPTEFYASETSGHTPGLYFDLREIIEEKTKAFIEKYQN